MQLPLFTQSRFIIIWLLHVVAKEAVANPDLHAVAMHRTKLIQSPVVWVPVHIIDNHIQAFLLGHFSPQTLCQILESRQHCVRKPADERYDSEDFARFPRHLQQLAYAAERPQELVDHKHSVASLMDSDRVVPIHEISA